MADHEIRENIQSLKTLMLKLYKRNPSELKKSTSEDPEKMVNWVFNGNHNWNFEAINNAQGTDAMYLTFSEDYKGDKVLPFIVGIYTMLIKAHGGKKNFIYLTQLTLSFCITPLVILKQLFGNSPTLKIVPVNPFC